jgi:Mrp family chromosome partitioning ATPase
MSKIYDKMEDAQQKTAAKRAQDEKDEAVKQSLQKIKHKLIVMSGKGGVGKTSTSVNLALALSRKGFRVGLMDVDLHGPDVPRMLGLEGLLDLDENQKLRPLRHSDNLSVISIEALTPSKDSAIIWRGPLKYAAIRQFIGDVGWGQLDYLIIDSPPGTGDEPLTVAQTIGDAQAVIVTTPQEISLADVRKSINFCQTVGMKILGLIENMSGFVCPHCGQSVDLFGCGGGERTALSAGIPFLGRVPFDQRMVECADRGRSVIIDHQQSPVAEALARIADEVNRLVGDSR